MAPSEAQKKATKKYHDKFDQLNIRVPKGFKEEIQLFATAHEETINKYVIRAINELMEREKKNPKPEIEKIRGKK